MDSASKIVLDNLEKDSQRLAEKIALEQVMLKKMEESVRNKQVEIANLAIDKRGIDRAISYFADMRGDEEDE